MKALSNFIVKELDFGWKERSYTSHDIKQGIRNLGMKIVFCLSQGRKFLVCEDDDDDGDGDDVNLTKKRMRVGVIVLKWMKYEIRLEL